MPKPLRILIVEDELPMQEVMEHLVDPLLRRFEGSTVTKTASLKETFSILSQYPAPDIVILDLTLSDATLSETISKLDQIDDRAPLVIVTGYRADFVNSLIKSARGYEVISKDDPGLSAKLMAGIVNAISAWHHRGYQEQVKRIQRMEEIIKGNEQTPATT